MEDGAAALEEAAAVEAALLEGVKAAANATAGALVVVGDVCDVVFLVVLAANVGCLLDLTKSGSLCLLGLR